MAKEKVKADSFEYLRQAAVTLGLDPESLDVMDWLIEVHATEDEGELSSHVSAPAGVSYELARSACDAALETRMAESMTPAQIHAHYGQYGGAGARDEGAIHAGWEQDRRMAELAESGQAAEVIGQRFRGISADAVRKAIKRHRKYGDEREAELKAASPEQREMRARLLARLRQRRGE